MKILKSLRIFFFCTFIAVLLMTGVSAANSDISPAISFLRKTTTLDKCSVDGETVSFTKDDFLDTVGADFDYIVISTLPSDGVLTLNGVTVSTGQTIPVASLDYLKFMPSGSEAKTCKFTFTTRASGWENTDVGCVINILTDDNFSPVASGGSLTTMENITVYGELKVVEPDNDSVTYNIIKFPRNGYARIGGDGSIVYTPRRGYNGSDTLIYTASDKYGNKSAEARIDIKVIENDSGIYFEDLKTSRIHLDAIEMAKNNIMTYSYDNGLYLFSPSAQVSRIDYLVMLMSAAGLDKEMTAVADTDFLDDGQLSTGRKGYLAKALALGIVDLGQGIFDPLKTITKAEAAVMTASALSLPELSATQTFVDINEVPQWAATAVASSTNLGIFEGDKGYFSPNKLMTRGDVAGVLSNVLSYIKDNNVKPIENL
ncbi:MAG: S-layer homology domain-containing protein [Eubacteriales bacterium]|nr:S-layer homology domain-containing protein [Eubacteriales bacterium]